MDKDADYIFWIRTFLSKRFEIPVHSHRTMPCIKCTWKETRLQQKNTQYLAWQDHTLVFTIRGAMGNECKWFTSKLSRSLSIKRNSSKSIVALWVSKKINFGQIRSMLLCSIGSRTIKNDAIMIKNIKIYEKHFRY